MCPKRIQIACTHAQDESLLANRRLQVHCSRPRDLGDVHLKAWAEEDVPRDYTVFVYGADAAIAAASQEGR